MKQKMQQYSQKIQTYKNQSGEKIELRSKENAFQFTVNEVYRQKQ
jgi:hypothetical protein